jgi:hypothetical protein
MVLIAFQISVIQDKPQINVCCPGPPKPESCVLLYVRKNTMDVLIRGLWERWTGCIIGVRVMETDATTFIKKDPSTVIEASE